MTDRPRPQRPDRRRFLALAPAALGALFPRGAGSRPRLRRAPFDPRLTARPRAPFRDAPVGESQLLPDVERGALAYVPGSYQHDRPSPLVVALHGGGGRAARWRSWYDVCEDLGIVLVAPDARERTWDRAHSGAFGPDVRFLDSCLRWIFERCAIDERRLALMGFSDGASYALSLAPSNGDLFTHVIAFSPGFSDPEEPIVGRPRIFVSHGSRDGVLPVGVTRDGLAPMFEMDGYDVRYEEFDGAHEMPEAVVDGALEWFLG